MRGKNKKVKTILKIKSEDLKLFFVTLGYKIVKANQKQPKRFSGTVGFVSAWCASRDGFIARHLLMLANDLAEEDIWVTTVTSKDDFDITNPEYSEISDAS